MQLSHALLAFTLAITPACKGDASPTTDAAVAVDTPVAIDAMIDGATIDGPKFCDSETRDDVYVPGMIKVGDNGYAFELVSSTPGPPPKGNSAWVVRIRHPDPIDNLALTIVPFMPDHGHGTSVQAVITPMANGTYGIAPVNLFMTGFWSVRIGIADQATPATELDHVAFLWCVSS
ncbi:MAG: FixH family protein [Proteobacteria bacterium]|nr:FixH family protein [Pseudomonadota bacterium]